MSINRKSHPVIQIIDAELSQILNNSEFDVKEKATALKHLLNVIDLSRDSVFDMFIKCIDFSELLKHVEQVLNEHRESRGTTMLTKQHILTTTCALAELEFAYHERRPDPHDPVYITFHGAVQDIRDDKCSEILKHVEQFLEAMGYRDNMTEDEILDMLSGTGFEF